MSIKIWHACYDNGNFGDHVGRYVLEKLTGQPTEFCHDSRMYDEVYVYSGSVLSETKDNWVCFGLGFGDESQTIHEVPRKIMSVRGKLSRNMLLQQGVECPDIYFDICEYLPKIFKPHTDKIYQVGYLPHYVDYEEYLTRHAANSDVKVINICNLTEQVIYELLQCETIISTSLHGLILADVYQVPRTWDKSPRLKSEFKFHDYFSRFD